MFALNGPRDEPGEPVERLRVRHSAGVGRAVCKLQLAQSFSDEGNEERACSLANFTKGGENRIISAFLQLGVLSQSALHRMQKTFTLWKTKRCSSLR